eukprot:CAMPEP_0172828332 /NCGR_PEP_ID=MMETSP1075-20121228/20768_1 /TAXON_ID=2916 /ORGANISM="Ceratium fusus, Strain PA161109" /LENGTH=583 /DNA_ID=CAMNT_0013670313 /DNA_START=64 /DNA_END=1815 /DNA_ORIENTATION=-
MASTDGGYPQTGEASFQAEDEKHFKARQREKRFDAGVKFGCLHGRTVTGTHNLWGRQSWRRERPEDVEELRVERPEMDEGIGLSALDLSRPLLTSTPVKEGLAEDLCEELQQLCVSSSIHRHPQNPDFAVRVFELPVVGHRLGQEIIKAETQVQLYTPPVRKCPGAVPPIFATIMNSPPEHVLEKTLLQRAKLNWKGCAELPTKKSGRSCGVRPRNAAIRYFTDATRQQVFSSHLDCWIQDVPESYLEVDLGADCHVTYVSTAGRFPPTERYPSLELQREWAEETGKDRVNEQWTVVKPGAPGYEQWVTHYELFARCNGGRAWETMGSFKGNVDMITEVAHDLRRICHNPDGLKCRYLRFLPQSFHGKAAMRIGVYGVGFEKEPTAVKTSMQEERVRYLVPVPLTNRNGRRCQRDFISRRNYSPDWYGKYGAEYKISTRRRQRVRDAVVQAAEALGKDRKALILRQDSALDQSDGEELQANGQVVDNIVRPAVCRLAPASQHQLIRCLPAAETNTEANEEGHNDDATSKGAGAEPEQPKLARAMSRRIEEVLTEQPVLQRTRTDDERGYCSEPDELLADWTMV